MTDAPRVLIVSSHAQRGGAESYVLRLMAGLGARIRPTVVALEEGPLGDDVREAGVECVAIPTGRRLGIAGGARRLRRIVRRSRPDVVHANGVKAAAVAGLALLGRRERVVWVKHDHSWDGRWGRLVARMVDLVVGVSESAVRSLRAGPSVRVVPQGVAVAPVDRAAARRALRDELGLQPDAPVLMCVGRLDPAKGFDDAVRALALLLPRHPSAHLAIVGGPDPKHPRTADAIDERAAELDVAGHVRRLGWRADVQSLIAAADVVLVTSRAIDKRGTGHEGFGLVAAEAVLLGVPVVGFRNGATPEVVGAAGLLVPGGDVPALADTVHTVLADAGVRGRLAAAAAERASSYDVDRWLDAMAGVYAELAGRRSGTE